MLEQPPKSNKMLSGKDKAQWEEVIQDWLIARVATWLLVTTTSEIDIEETFAGYGFTSIAAVSMTGDLEEWLGVELSPTLAYEYPTIGSLAQHLAEMVVQTQTVTAID